MGLKHHPRVVTNGLQVYLDAANSRSYSGSGNTWYDLLGNRNFTLQNNPPFIANSAGGSIGFTAANSHSASALSLPYMSRWSIEVWHYFTGVNTGLWPTIITEAYPLNLNYNLGATTSNTTNTKLRVGHYPGGWRQTTEYSLIQNRWYHLMGSFDGTNINLYVDGILELSTTDTGAPQSSGSGIYLMKMWNGTDYWGGLLNIVRFYNRALSAQEVLQNYNATKKRY